MASSPSLVAPERKFGFASPHNFAAEVRGQMHLPERVILNDLTLREGRGLDGVFLDEKDFETIAKGLADAGVPMIQLHYVPEELKHFAKLKLPMKAEVLISSPYQRPPYTISAHREKIDLVADLGLAPDLCFGTSDHLLLGRQDIQGREQLTAEELRKRELAAAVDAVQYGKQRGAAVHTNFQDFLRADFTFVKQLCRELAKAGIDLITLDDFAGPGIPAAYKYAVEQIKKEVPRTPLGIHVTNDFGLGSALVLGAFEGGAEVLDVGVNNYGERTGHADLAEIAVALEVFYNQSTGIKLEKMFELSKLASQAFRVAVPTFKPLVGDKAFADVGDVHYSYTHHPWIYRVVPDNLVGNRRVIAFGDKSGPHGVKAKAAALGIALEEKNVGKVVDNLLAKLREVRRPITDAEFRALAQV